jgi:pyruvate dehydrogenase E2 component (dihydrolipoamide acetyltransferase)
MTEVIMPKMSDAMTEGKVIAWRKRAGEAVQRGDVIAEIETDKVNVEIEADAGGVLSEILVPAGGVAPVGAVIAHINGKPAARGDAPATPKEAPAARQEAPAQDVGAQAADPDLSAPARVTPSPPAPPGGEQPREPQPAADDQDRVKASPIARRLAAERGIDLGSIRGSGPGGRVVERDLETYLAAQAAPLEVPPAAPARGAPEAEYEDVELSPMRQAIARVVTQSVHDAPHFYVTAEADMTRALALRKELRDAHGGAEPDVSVNDLILKATALALRQHPDLNAQFVPPKTLRRFRRVHLGIMVAVPGGLIAPVLRDADRLPLLTLAREAQRLIERTRGRHLAAHEVQGATFSVTNLGMFDVTEFAAIINAPQAAILATGRIQQRARIHDGQMIPRPVLGMTIAADHRVVDGAGAAEFLASVRRLLENPILLAMT